jgi:hypothetical protein
VDVTDGDGYDPVIQSDRTPQNAAADEHNHLYNAQDTPKDNTNVFAPGGGRVVGSGVDDGQNWTSVYYRKLGGVSNVIIQFWHVENNTGGISQGGRLLLGQMGENGSIPYYRNQDGLLILIARLGNGENRRELNRRRLYNVRLKLNTEHAVQKERIIVAEGERLRGFRRVEFYVGGELVGALPVQKQRDICVGCCDPDERFYPYKQKSKTK